MEDFNKMIRNTLILAAVFGLGFYFGQQRAHGRGFASFGKQLDDTIDELRSELNGEQSGYFANVWKAITAPLDK